MKKEPLQLCKGFFITFDSMNFKKQLKDRAAKVANINAQRRKLTRKEDRELEYINAAFDKLIHNFSETLLGADWEHPQIKHLNPFNDYNKYWVAWCEKYNKDKKHIVNANETAFYDMAIDNTKTNDYDTIFYFTNNQLSNLRWAL